MILNRHSQNSFGEVETHSSHCKKLQDFSLQVTCIQKRKGAIGNFKKYMEEGRKGRREGGRKLSLCRVEAKYVRGSMNITNDPKQDSCAQDV